MKEKIQIIKIKGHNDEDLFLIRRVVVSRILRSLIYTYLHGYFTNDKHWFFEWIGCPFGAEDGVIGKCHKPSLELAQNFLNKYLEHGEWKRPKSLTLYGAEVIKEL